MLNIKKDGTIQLTRGDSARISVSITFDENTPYTVQVGDVVMLSVKKTIADEQYVLQKTMRDDLLFYIEPQDTKSIPFGRYVYDVQITRANGDVYTIIEPSTFEIRQEVTV